MQNSIYSSAKKKIQYIQNVDFQSWMMQRVVVFNLNYDETQCKSITILIEDFLKLSLWSEGFGLIGPSP